MDGLIVYVNVVGVYILAIVDLEIGCMNLGEIYVEVDMILFIVDVGDDFVINCGVILVSLDGVGLDCGVYIFY